MFLPSWKDPFLPWAVVEGSESQAIPEDSACPLNCHGSPAPMHCPRGICIWYHPGGVFIILCHPGRCASSVYHSGGVCINMPSQKDLHHLHAIPEGSAASLCHLEGFCIILRHP